MSVPTSIPLRRTISLAVLLLTAALSAVAQTTILSDSFSRSGTLAGSAPDLRASGTETWQNAHGWTTDGTKLTPTGGAGTQWLPITITNGVTYSASVSLSLSTYSSVNWLSLGFGNFTTGSHMTSVGGPWLLLRQNGGAQAFGSQGVSFTAVADKPAGTYSTTTATLRINYAVAANGTAIASYYINDSLVVSYDYGSNVPSVLGVGLSNNNLNYESNGVWFDNFSVTATAVPEPSTYTALVGVAALSFVAWRRRKTPAKA